MSVSLLRHLLAWIVLGFSLFLSGHSGLYSSSEVGLLRWLVLGILAAGACCFFFALLAEKLDKRLWPLFWGSAAMVLSQAISLLAAGSFAPVDAPRFFELLAQQLLIVLWIGFGLTLDWRNRGAFWLAVISGIAVMLTNLADWVIKEMPFPFEGFSTGKNGLAAAACIGILIALAPIRPSKNILELLASRTLGLLSIIALIASGGRASIVFLFTFFLAKWSFPYLKRTRLGPVFVTIGLISVLTAIPYIYINLENLSWFARVDKLLSSITHSAYSGRETLWPAVIDGISNHPFIGNGTSASWRFERRAYGLTQELSAHNLYLAILYQTGLVGLLGFVCMISALLYSLWLSPDSQRIRFSFGVLIAALFREVWEVSLTQNTLQVGLGVWILITLGLSIGSSKASDDQ